MRPKAVLLESDIKPHHHFDSVPFANLRLSDVARVLDIETSKPNMSSTVVGKLLGRVLGGLTHTVIALQGRPDGRRVLDLLYRSFNRILDRIPEFGTSNESLLQLHQMSALMPVTEGLEIPPLDEKLVLRDYRKYAELVTDAYDARPVRDPAAKASYAALLKHVRRMFKQLLSRVRIEWVDEAEPYKDASDMTRRVKAEGVMYVSTLFSSNLVSGWTPHENWMFRAVHDYIVHIGGNHDFSLRGEIATFNRHSKVAPRDALPALFGEIVGQVAYMLVRGKFPAPQKACVLYGFDYVKIGEVNPEEYARNWTEGL